MIRKNTKENFLIGNRIESRSMIEENGDECSKWRHDEELGSKANNIKTKIIKELKFNFK